MNLVVNNLEIFDFHRKFIHLTIFNNIKLIDSFL